MSRAAGWSDGTGEVPRVLYLAEQGTDTRGLAVAQNGRLLRRDDGTGARVRSRMIEKGDGAGGPA